MPGITGLQNIDGTSFLSQTLLRVSTNTQNFMKYWTWKSEGFSGASW